MHHASAPSLPILTSGFAQCFSAFPRILPEWPMRKDAWPRALCLFALGVLTPLPARAQAPQPARAVLSQPVLEQPPSQPEPKAESLPQPALAAPAPKLFPHPPDPRGRPLPINLPTALRLAEVSPLDIAIAGQRLEVAAAQLDRANRLWLPTIFLGADYFRHDGQLQHVTGTVVGPSQTNM